MEEEQNKDHDKIFLEQGILDDGAISSSITFTRPSSSGPASPFSSFAINLSPAIQTFIKGISRNIPLSSLSSLLVYSSEDEAQHNTDELSGVLFDHIDKLPSSSTVRRELSFDTNVVGNKNTTIIDATPASEGGNDQEIVSIENIDDSILLECMNALIYGLAQRWESEQAHHTAALEQDYDKLVSELPLPELGKAEEEYSWDSNSSDHQSARSSTRSPTKRSRDLLSSTSSSLSEECIDNEPAATRPKRSHSFSSNSSQDTSCTKSSRPGAPDKKLKILELEDQASFPQLLHHMLTTASRTSPHIMSWTEDSTGFIFHRAKSNEISSILGQYFESDKYKSLKRRLNSWGFRSMGSFHFAHIEDKFPRYIDKWEDLDGVVRRPDGGTKSKRMKKSSSFKQKSPNNAQLLHSVAEIVKKVEDNPDLGNKILLSLALENVNHTPISPQPKRGSIIRRNFTWSEYPPLEAILQKNIQEHYEQSVKLQTQDLVEFHNNLVYLIKDAASKRSWRFDFDETVFTNEKLRHCVRKYFKHHMRDARRKFDAMMQNPMEEANAKELVHHVSLIDKGGKK